MNDDWTSASFRAALVAMVRRRVPDRDADDVVQAALAEAVAARDRLSDPEGARRWIWTVARNKIADYHRRARRETTDVPEQTAPASDEAERDLLRWAVGELPPGSDAQKTFEWLLREGDGEKLEEIAAQEKLPAPQVRQRVSRLRRLFRARWAQLAAAGVVALVVYLALRRVRTDTYTAQHDPPRVLEDPALVASRHRGRVLRVRALAECEEAHWARCIELLDEARALDPVGDESLPVREARQLAHDANERERPPAPPPRRAPPPTPRVDRDAGDDVIDTSDASVDVPPARVRRRNPSLVAPISPVSGAS